MARGTRAEYLRYAAKGVLEGIITLVSGKNPDDTDFTLPVALDAATLAALTPPAGGATAAKQDTGNTSLATIATNTGAATPAGTNYMGQVGSSDDTITTALTVSISPAYTAKDSIGNKITIAGALRAAGATSILHSLMLMDRSGQKPTGYILVFNADPTAATITDNAAFVSSTDDAKIIAQIPVTASDWATPGATKSFANIRNIGALVEAASGTSLYAAFVCDSTPTFVATTDVQIVWGFLR